MAEPDSKTFEISREYLLDIFPDILDSAGMKLVGKNDELGLISFRNGGEHIYHAHITEEPDEENSAAVTMAPGLPNMKDQDQSKLPKNNIRKVYLELDKYMLEIDD